MLTPSAHKLTICLIPVFQFQTVTSLDFSGRPAMNMAMYELCITKVQGICRAVQVCAMNFCSCIMSGWGSPVDMETKWILPTPNLSIPGIRKNWTLSDWDCLLCFIELDSDKKILRGIYGEPGPSTADTQIPFFPSIT